MNWKKQRKGEKRLAARAPEKAGESSVHRRNGEVPGEKV
jgi:hypothetical protein